MKVSYNWLKSYVPDLPEAEKLREIFNNFLCEVEELKELPNKDIIFDVDILPNRAHDLLSHQGIAKEVSRLLGIEYKDPAYLYKVPESSATELQIDIQTNKCRRYMGRVVRDIQVRESSEWMRNYLESIGQKSINNIIDAANIVMFDCGQPIHCFDLDKLRGGIVVRQARAREEMTTLDNKEVALTEEDMVIADSEQTLAVAGIKGSKLAEVDENTKNIVIEIANFDPTSVRKTWRRINTFTDAGKRFENDLSPTLGDFAMLEMSGLLVDVAGDNAKFEDVVDKYPIKQEERKLKFSTNRMSSILGLEITQDQILEILSRYEYEFVQNGDAFEITVPPMRQDLTIEEDMAEEVGRILGYDNIEPKIPNTKFKSGADKVYQSISKARRFLLLSGYSEVMTYSFRNKGKIEVLKSASDKNFLRTNIKGGIEESLKLNKTNLPYLGMKDVKVFEIGAVFLKDKNTGEMREEVHVAWGDKSGVQEKTLEEYVSSQSFDSESTDVSLLRNSSARHSQLAQGSHSQSPASEGSVFKMWSLFPYIVRDIALWVPEGVGADEVINVIKESMGDLVVRGPELFDEFHKEGEVSYAFKLIFQSHEKTLTDIEVSEVVDKISALLEEREGWQVR